MAKNSVKFTQSLKRVGTADIEPERNRAGAKVIERWEQLVKNTPGESTWKKLIVCVRTVKWWGEEAEGAIE